MDPIKPEQLVPRFCGYLGIQRRDIVKVENLIINRATTLEDASFNPCTIAAGWIFAHMKDKNPPVEGLSMVSLATQAKLTTATLRRYLSLISKNVD